MSNEIEVNVFLEATRQHLKFASSRGELTTEQLWDVPLTSNNGFNLDVIARTANQELKTAQEETFVKPKRSDVELQLKLKFDVVKAVIDWKIADADRKRNLEELRQRRGILESALEKRQMDSLNNMTEAEIRAELAKLKD